MTKGKRVIDLRIFGTFVSRILILSIFQMTQLGVLGYMASIFAVMGILVT